MKRKKRWGNLPDEIYLERGTRADKRGEPRPRAPSSRSRRVAGTWRGGADRPMRRWAALQQELRSNRRLAVAAGWLAWIWMVESWWPLALDDDVDTQRSRWRATGGVRSLRESLLLLCSSGLVIDVPWAIAHHLYMGAPTIWGPQAAARGNP
jgi:hypothetical protein